MCGLAVRKQLQGCVYGVYRKVLDSQLQHSGTNLQHCPRSLQVCESYPGKKANKRDTKWISDIFKHDLAIESFIPPADIRQLRDLVRYRWKLACFTTGERNRAHHCLTVSNFKLDDVFSDVFGKATSAITARVLECPTDKIAEVFDCFWFCLEIGCSNQERL